MIKDIKFSGYSAQPSDYECHDGDLSSSINLLNEDGHLKSVSQPREELSLSTGHALLLIHSVPGQENYIIMTGDKNGTFGVSWLKREPFDKLAPLPSTAGASPISNAQTFHKLLDIGIVGNTLAIATSEGLFYILWKDDNYKYLGSRPPFLPISFGAYQAGGLTDSTSTTYSSVPRATYVHYSGRYTGANMPHVSWTKEDDAFWAQVSNEALGLLLSNVAETVTSNGYQYQPFYIRYAFRLYDGSYSWHSAPILMLVSTHRPIISISCAGGDDSSMTVTCRLSVPYFGISYRIFGTIDLLKEWSDIVSGVDVFISSPLYTYNQDKEITRPISRYRLYDGIYLGGGHRGRDTSSGTSSTDDTATKVLVGHYGTSIDGPYTDHYITTPWSEMRDLVCALAKNENFNDKVQHEFLFYKISSLSIDEIATMSKMERLPLLKADLANINTLESLPDEYNSHATILPGALHTYNQRLLMGDISIAPPKPFPVCSLVQAATKTSTTDETLRPIDAMERIKVFTRINGKICVSEYAQPLPQTTADPGSYPFDECFPRFIYHPDASAYKMEITTPDGKFYSLPLKQHPHLNGVYWFGGMGGDPTNIFDEKDTTDGATSAIVANKIYISEINNPFVFPVTNIVTIGCGRIFSLRSAAKALSQGQFGQFPLYAFTDEGIWALEVSATGTISARQPITRDVCINPDAITQIDSAVLFPTDRGIMVISGSTATCISEEINDNSPFDVLHLPHLSEMHLMLNHGEDTCLPTQPFIDFLINSNILYDYPHQRIIVYSTNYTYAYIYSLKSKLWGMTYSQIDYSVNSYPEALAVKKNGRMVNFAHTDGNAVSGLLVTRPLKLETPDVLKTIDTIIQRGHFRKGHVQSALYGSRDLYNWHLVWSSKDHYLRGFRGTPYKYFRIACVTNLSDDESIFGASLQFTPRLTNQPR